MDSIKTIVSRDSDGTRTRNLLLRRQLLYPVELLNPEKRQPALFSECKISTINIHNQIKLYFFCRLFLWLDLISAPGMDRQETARCLSEAVRYPFSAWCLTAAGRGPCGRPS